MAAVATAPKAGAPADQGTIRTKIRPGWTASRGPASTGGS